MKTLLICILGMAVFCGCLNEKHLAKKQVVFTVEPVGNGKAQIKAYNSGNNKIHVTFKDSSDVILITNKDTGANKFILPTIVTTGFNTNAKYAKLSSSKMYYFPETLFPVAGDSNSNHFFVSPQKLQYSVNNFVMQVVTMPLKIRPSFTRKRLKDSLPLQALAELNLGIAVGLKRTWGRYKAHPFENGQKASSISLSGTTFVSVGATNVKPITVRYYRPYEKTETVLSYGACLLFGFNNINIGLSAGTDHLFNRDIGKRWLYDGSIWYGVTLAYDILKR